MASPLHFALHPNWNLGISFSYNAKGIDELKFNMKLNGSKQTTNKSGCVGSWGFIGQTLINKSVLDIIMQSNQAIKR